MRTAISALTLALLASPALAHSPYLAPNFFDLTGRDHVTVQGSFTEVFLEPEIVMKSDAYAVVGPDGARTALTPVYLTDLAVVEAKTAGPGTYRITTGPRVGRTAKAYLDKSKGAWVFLEEPNSPVPAGSELVDMQSLTTAEVYVSKGAPNDKALAAIGVGLEFRPITHPTAIFAGKDAEFQALFDGKPAAGVEIEVNQADGRYGDGKPPVMLKTGADGRFKVHTSRQGLYHIMGRNRVPPGNGFSQARSFTYALTFEAGE